MGTEYKLYEDDSFGELTLYEMSNKLTIYYQNNITFDAPKELSAELTPEEFAKIMLEGLTVCSYWMNTNELKELIKDHMYHKIY